MASANFQLASQRANTGGMPNGVSPVTVSGASKGRVVAPQINTNSANLAYTAVQPPQIVYNTMGDSAAKFADVWANAAFKFQEAEAQLEADEISLQLKAEHQKVLTEYQNKIGGDAVKGFGDFQQQAAAIAAPFISGAAPNVKAKFLLRAKELEANALMVGAGHKAQQLRVQQGVVFEKQTMDMVNDIVSASDSPDPAVFDGAVQKQMDNIALQFAGREDKVALEQAKFKEGIYTAVIEQSMGAGLYEKAGAYIAKGFNDGLNEGSMAVLLKKNEKAMDTAIKQKEREWLHDQRMSAANSDMIARNTLRKAIKTQDPSLIKKHLPAELWGKYTDMFNKSLELHDPLPGAEATFYQDLKDLVERPDVFWEDEKYRALGNKQNALYEKLIGWADSEEGDLYKSMSKQINTLFPSGPNDKYDPTAAQAKDTMIQEMNAVIDEAKGANRSPELAVNNWFQDRLRDPQGFSKYMTITKGALPTLPVADHHFYSFDQYDQRGEAISPSSVEQAYMMANRELTNVEYGLKGKTAAEKQAWFMANPAAMEAFARDALAIEMHYLYWSRKVNFDGKKSTTGVEAAYE